MWAVMPTEEQYPGVNDWIMRMRRGLNSAAFDEAVEDQKLAILALMRSRLPVSVDIFNRQIREFWDNRNATRRKIPQISEGSSTFSGGVIPDSLYYFMIQPTNANPIGFPLGHPKINLSLIGRQGGQLYTFGAWTSLGRSEHEGKIALVRGFDNVRMVSIGSREVTFITTDDNLYKFSDETAFQTKEDFDRGLPAQIDAPKLIEGFKVKDVSCGNGIVIFLTTGGQIFLMGNVPYGLTRSIERGYKGPTLLPVDLPPGVEVTKVACHDAIVFIAGGRLYTLAMAAIASGRPNATEFIGPVPGFDAVTDVSCGGRKITFIDRGRVFEISSRDDSITQISPVVGAFQVSRGDEHGAFVTDEDTSLYTYGSIGSWDQSGGGGLGQFPLGDLNNRQRPAKLLEGYLVKQVSCGRGVTIFSTLDGMVFTMGSNRYGQLGRKDPSGLVTQEKSMITILPGEVDGNFRGVKYVATGGEVSAFIL